MVIELVEREGRKKIGAFGCMNGQKKGEKYGCHFNLLKYKRNILQKIMVLPNS